jgi:TonB-linked SusC/RagA family outer membrane protein
MQLKALFSPVVVSMSAHGHSARRLLTKTLLIMRLTAILLISGFLQVSAAGYSQKVTLSEKNVSLETVFSQIRKQTGFTFFYNESLLDQASKVSIDVRKADLSTALDQCFRDQPLIYSIIGSTVVVKAKVTRPVPKPDMHEQEGPDQSPPNEIRGHVINTVGEPLVNANVVVKRTKKGTITNARGEFVLTGARPEDTLNISFVGYKSVNIKVGVQTDMFITMEPTQNKLDQVVVQAYGTTSQRLTTGNIGRVTSEEIEKQPVMNPLMALQGRVAGLVVTPTTGFAAGPVKVEIRGRNTIDPSKTSDPLYIIDGVPLTILEVGGTSSYQTGSSGIVQTYGSATSGQSPFFNLNPSDIESIEVLKDADATAIYGSRGANGVILITTKKGKAGNTRFNLNATQGMSLVTGHWDMLNTRQYLQMRREAFRNDGITPNITNAPDMFLWDTTRSVDWQKAAWGGTGKLTDLTANLSGGDAITSFRIGGNFHRQTEIMTTSGANQRGNLSFNITHHALAQKLMMSLTGNYSYSSVNMTLYPNVVSLAPNAPAPFDGKGNLNFAPWDAAGPSFSMPFGGLLMPSTSGTSMLTSSMLFSYEIVKGLTVSTTIGYNNMQNKLTSLIPIASQDPVTSPTGRAIFASNSNFNWLVEPEIGYKTFIDKGKLNIQLGGSYQSAATDGLMLMGFGFADDALIHSIVNATSVLHMEGYGQYKYVAGYGRINYNWENKYILNLNARRDGSSRFGPGRQFGNFASAGVAWIATEEKWLKSLLPSAISLVKLRGSYGTSGSDAVGDYQYLSQWSNALGPSGVYSYAGYVPLISQHAVNQDYHWQVNKKLEVAMDLGLFKDRISLEAAYYRNRCNNQLTNFPTSVFTGFNSVIANWPANVQNDGFEFVFNARLVDVKDFTWSANFNIGINRNKLISYPDIAQSPYVGQYKTGRSLNTQYVLHYRGVDPLTGQRSYVDYNHDGKINTDQTVSPGTVDDDNYVGIDLSPAYTGGFGNQFSYKNCQLSLFFSFKKQWGLNAFYGSNPPGGPQNQSSKIMNDHWQKPGDQTTFARFTTVAVGSDINFNQSDGIYTDASFIRLSNLAFSYNLPAGMVRKAGMQGCHLFINAQNIFVITRYKGVDPETQNFGSMPPARVFTGGVSFTF